MLGVSKRSNTFIKKKCFGKWKKAQKNWQRYVSTTTTTSFI